MAGPPPQQSQEAIALLKDDHAQLEKQFTELKRIQDQGTEGVDALKLQLVEKVRRMLTAHADIDEGMALGRADEPHDAHPLVKEKPSVWERLSQLQRGPGAS